MKAPTQSVEGVDEFFDDLADYAEAGPMLGMEPQSIPVAICRGKLPLTRYKRGRKTYLSKREIVALIKRRAMPAPQQPENAA